MADDTRPSITHKAVSAASTNATSVTTFPTRLTFVCVTNVNAAVRYIKFYDQTAAPTVGTDTPVQTYAIQGGATGLSTIIPMPQGGLAFTKGLAYAMTTEATDAGSTGVSVSEHVINLGYQRATP